MKLYSSRKTTSISAIIVILECNIKCDIIHIDIDNKKLPDGSNYYDLNVKGQVPALEIHPGNLLTETAVILQYLADLVPEKKLMPPAGSMDRYRAQEWLNLIASEIHKPFSLLFNAKESYTAVGLLRATLAMRNGLRETPTHSVLLRAFADGRPYLMGDHFTATDSYLFNVLSWGHYADTLMRDDETPLKHYIKRIRQRPAVQRAIQLEAA